MADDKIGILESSTPSKYLDAESVVFGTTTVYRERMQIAGTASGQIAGVTSGIPATNALGANVRIVPSTGQIGVVTDILTFAGLTIIPISGNTSVSPAAGTTFNIAGNVSAVVANSSGAITTANPLAVILQGSTATVTIQGNATAILTTGSKVQVEGVAGAVFPISGNTTAILTTGSKVQVEPAANTTFAIGNSSGGFTTANPLPVILQGSTATVTIQGNTTAVLTTGSKVQVEPVAGAVFGISGNTTALLTTGSKVQVEPVASGSPFGDLGNATYANKTLTASGSTVLWASAAGIRMNITALSFVNLGATGTVFEIWSGGSATMLFRGGGASGFGGQNLAFPMPLRGTTGEAINVYLESGTTAAIHISGFRS